jgi:hypothetical protein
MAMTTLKELEQEMNRQSVDLYTRVTEARDADSSPNSVQKLMDRFLVEWSARLTEDRESQIKEAHVQIDREHPEIRDDRSVSNERERAERINAVFRYAEADIKNQVSELRNKMIEAVQDIEKGRQPNIALEPTYQIQMRDASDRPATPRRTAEIAETWEALAARKQREAGVEPSSHKEDISLDREK